MRIADFHRLLADYGALPVHRERMLRAWLQGRPLDVGASRQPAERFLPLAVRNSLPQLNATLDGLAQIRSEHPAADGSARLLVELSDGQLVESVLLPRDGVCVSTQVGCAVGCRFCMTGKSGLLRQLGSLEILAQVVLARRRRPVKKVVFMGMGEPAHNLDNVLEAIDLLGTLAGIGHKNLVFSTVGDRRVFDLLPQQRVKPGLALSLHTTKAALREQLLPKAPRIDPHELIEHCDRYSRLIGYPTQYQWTLLEGVNDGPEEFEEVVRLLRGQYAVFNLIPFNRLEGSDGNGYQRPTGARIIDIVRHLNANGVLTKVRNSAGQDVDGGCGQLRARAVE
jgi:23S rRNA (adenine2503-C2)-methyltransferase